MSKNVFSPPAEVLRSMEFFRMPGYYEDNFWRIVAHLVWVGTLMFAFAVLLIIGTLLHENFLTFGNLKTILSDLLTIGLMASVMVIIFSNGGLDLSVGSVMSLVGTVLAFLLQQGSNPVNALFLGLSLALLIGLINGVLVGIARIPGILITFAMMFLVRGISYSISGGSSIQFDPPDSLVLSGLKISGWVLFILVGVAAALLVQFPVLERILSLKQLEKAQSWFFQACFLGIPYMCSGLLAGFVGLIQTARLRASMPIPSTGFEVQVILAVVLGGTCLGGRFGNVIGALFGTLFIATLQNILALTNASSFHRQLITGALFLIATGLCYGYNEVVGMLYRRQSQSGSEQV